jgi:hypothetical protein
MRRIETLTTVGGAGFPEVLNFGPLQVGDLIDTISFLKTDAIAMVVEVGLFPNRVDVAGFPAGVEMLTPPSVPITVNVLQWDWMVWRKVQNEQERYLAVFMEGTASTTLVSCLTVRP